MPKNSGTLRLTCVLFRAFHLLGSPLASFLLCAAFLALENAWRNLFPLVLTRFLLYWHGMPPFSYRTELLITVWTHNQHLRFRCTPKSDNHRGDEADAGENKKYHDGVA